MATLMVLLTWGAVLGGNLLAADETRGSLVEGGFARGRPSGLEWGLPGCVLGSTLMVLLDWGVTWGTCPRLMLLRDRGWGSPSVVQVRGEVTLVDLLT